MSRETCFARICKQRIHDLDVKCQFTLDRKLSCYCPIGFQVIRGSGKLVGGCDKCVDECFGVSTSCHIRSQVDAQDAFIRSDGIGQWLFGSTPHRLELLLHPFSHGRDIFHGVFAPQRRLLDQFVYILRLPVRISAVMVQQDVSEWIG